MLRIMIIALLLTLPALGQSKVLSWTSATTPEDAWGSQGNGGGDFNGTFLMQPINEPLTCVGQTDICVSGAHGALHIADFGTGPFLMDEQGYIFSFPVWSSEIVRPECDVRTFANGVH